MTNDHGETEITDDGRRDADAELYRRFSAGELTAAEHDHFFTELAKSAYGPLMGMLATGRVFDLCARQNRPVGPPPYDWSPDDRTELVLETVAKALQRFAIQPSSGRGWTPRGGASIRTYFMGTCIQTFPGVYRRWQREHRSWRRAEVSDDVAESVTSPGNDPQDIVVTRMTLDAELKGLDPLTAKVLTMSSLGYSHSDIARTLNTEPRAVEGVLYRHRHRLRRTHGIRRKRNGNDGRSRE